MPLRLSDIEMHTAAVEEHAHRMQKNVSRFTLDSEKEQRKRHQMCKTCYYFRSGGMTTQAFTDKPCKRWGCHGRTKWHNGSTPDYCTDCATEFGICRRCGGDQEFAHRRSMKPPKRR